MHQLDPFNFALTLLGMSVMLLQRFDEVRRKRSSKFSYKFWISDNWVRMVINIIFMLTLHLCQDYVKPVLGVEFNPLNSFLGGYGCSHLVRAAMSYMPFKTHNIPNNEAEG